jgi:hypothetical protein
MDLRRLGILLRLRYRLLWANVRTRNGKIALFLFSYLTACLIVALLALAGFGAGLAAIRARHADVAIARVVLGGFFLNALFSSIALGVGMNATFSDTALRRYPLSALERLAARQMLAFLEPLWMFVLAVDGGLAFGLYAVGVASLWLAMTAAVLLAAANYLLARVILTAISRVMVMRGGAFVLLIVFMVVCLLPSILAQTLSQNHSFAEGMLAALRFTPPLAAAAAMTSPQLAAVAGPLGILLGWCALALLSIALLERMPETPRSVARAAIGWDGPCDRIGRLFGAGQAPLVSKMLRYYLRNTRVRMNLIVAGPMLSFILMMQPAPNGPQSKFLMTLPFMAIVGFAASFAMSVNAFGYEADGFRRYLLLPVSPSSVMRAASIPPLLFGAAMLPVPVAVWAIFGRVHVDGRMLTMQVSSGIGGLLVLTACGIWTTLLAPRKTEFSSNFGNNLSLGGNVLVMGTFFGGIAGAVLFAAVARFDTVLAWWWTAPLFVPAGAAVLLLTLRASPGVFVARREKLLAVLEGRR